MRRLTYILLAAFVLQLAGLGGWCGPRTNPAHDCCPPAQGSPRPSSSPLPDCCLGTALRYQGSIAQTKTHNEMVGAVAQLEKTVLREQVPGVISSSLDARSLSQPISPPLSPLLQTCLLLI